ncbi:unnamed protein product [Closterium sp. NIES-54]
MSPHQPCGRAWHLLLYLVITVAEGGQTHLVDFDGAPVESRKMQRLRQKVSWLLGGRDVLQSNLPALHHLLYPGVASLHVLEVALDPQALWNRDGRLVVQQCRLHNVEQLELGKEEAESTCLLASFSGRDVLRFNRRECCALDALTHPGDGGPAEDEHLAARARPILLVTSVVGVCIADQTQQLWSAAELQSGITGVCEVVQTAVGLAPVVVTPHCQAAP